jgi:hypothetical protein
VIQISPVQTISLTGSRAEPGVANSKYFCTETHPINDLATPTFHFALGATG